MRQLHKPEAIFSLRHVPSWLLLAGSAGMVNGIAYMATSRFVTHVTGTATQLGMDAATLWLAFDIALVLVCFVAGAFAAASVIDVRAHRGKRPLYGLPLLVTGLLVGGAGVAGKLGAFGPFGGGVERPADFLLLSVLSFAMGLQNGAVATSTGMVVRTTHLTGPATDLGLSFAELLFARGERRGVAKRNAALRAAKIGSFVAGACVAVPAARAAQLGALVIPAAAILLANGLSFRDHYRRRAEREERAERDAVCMTEEPAAP